MKNPNENKYLLYDTMFKALFKDRSSILAKMISDISNLDYEDIFDKIIIRDSEFKVRNKEDKSKKGDIIVDIKDNNTYINVEMNRNYYSTYKYKNTIYLSILVETAFKKGKKYSNDVYVYQININAWKNNNDTKVTKEYRISEVDTNKAYLENIKIFELYLYNASDIYYNDINKTHANYIYWGAFLNLEKNEFYKIEEILSHVLCEEDVRYIVDKVATLMNDEKLLSDIELEILQEKEINTRIYEGKEEGIAIGEQKGIAIGEQKGIAIGEQKGFALGKEETVKELVNSMYKNGVSIEDISKITNIEVSKIKEIIE